MEGYSEMYTWIRRSLDTNIKNSLERTADEPPHFGDITLMILSSHNNTTQQIRYIDCVPVALGDIQFESTSTGDSFITFNASFRFSYFELKGVQPDGSITTKFSIRRR